MIALSLIEIFLYGIGLSMDAFAVSVCKGLAMKKTTLGKCSIVGLWFGSFQALMPFLGFLVGSLFSKYIERYDHWIAFALLVLIGFNMIKESFDKSEEEGTSGSLSFKVMLMMAIATSIDALAVGVAFSFEIYFTRMLLAILIIGITTFVISAVGTKVGNLFGARYKSKAELAGGVILILLGLKILLQDLGVVTLPF